MNCDFARNKEFTLEVRYVLFLVSTTIPSGNTNFCIFLFSSRIREDLQTYQLLTDEVKSLEQTKGNIEKEKEKTEQLLEKEKAFVLFV